MLRSFDRTREGNTSAMYTQMTEPCQIAKKNDKEDEQAQIRSIPMCFDDCSTTYQTAQSLNVSRLTFPSSRSSAANGLLRVLGWLDSVQGSVMSRCQYCNTRAGLFRNERPECVEKIDGGLKKLRDLTEKAVLENEDAPGVIQRTEVLIAEYRIPRSSANEIAILALDKAAGERARMTFLDPAEYRYDFAGPANVVQRRYGFSRTRLSNIPWHVDIRYVFVVVLCLWSLRAMAQLPLESQDRKQQEGAQAPAMGGSSTGGAHPALLDTEKRPITA